MFHRPQPFLQLTLPRVKKAQTRLEEILWNHVAPVQVFRETGDQDDLSIEQALQAEYTPVELPHHWGRLMQTRWFKLDIPETAESPVYLHWLDQGEGTLVLDGVPYYGFDVAHRTVALPENCREGYVEGLCHQSGVWHPEAKGIDPQGSCLQTARLVTRNEDAWHCLRDLDVLISLVKDEERRCPEFGALHEDGTGNKPKVEVVSPLLRRIIRGLDDAVCELDAGGPAAMRAGLQSLFDGLKREDSLVKGILTGHAHIDLVWLWREANAEYKARHTFASMNRLMDLYPEFRFAYSQSASYDAVAQTAPSLHEVVKGRIAEGKWEAVGATYVESDTIMACGEALARSFLVGQERFRDLFGESSRLLWLPDVFGYSGCLPQIMRQCGVDRFFTTKLTWSNINLFPYSSFLWKGTDGSEVLSHVTQGVGYNQNALPAESRKAADEYRQSDVHDEYLQPTGFGDGGGGVTPEMCERAQRLANLAGVPETHWGRLDDFYDRLEEAADRLPVYQGELYLEYHRGTVTTHGDLKEAFRGLERALMVQEAAHVLQGAGPVDGHAWRRLVFSQFHDYIPGSSIWEVYEEGLPELRALAAQAGQTTADVLGSGEAHVNLLGMTRKVSTPTGVVELPPLSAVRIGDLEPVSTNTNVIAEKDRLACGRVEATFTDCGEVENMTVDGVALPLTGPANQLMLYPDYPHQYPAWDIDRQTLHLGQRVESGATRTDWTPEVGSGVAFTRAVGKKSSVDIRYWIDPAHPVLQVELVLDWQEDHALLKAMFPTGYTGRFARYGSPYNSVLRSQQPGDPRDEAMFESCASRWMTVMDDGQSAGLSLITENKYGVSCREGTVGLSLVRSVPVSGEQGTSDIRLMIPSLREGGERSSLSDQRVHTIRYAVGPWQSASPRQEQAAALADLLYTPVLQAETTCSAGLSGLRGGDSLIPAWCKPLENGDWILRLHEVLGRSGHVEVELEDGWALSRTRLAEDEEEPCDTSVPFRAYEVVSLCLRKA